RRFAWRCPLYKAEPRSKLEQMSFPRVFRPGLSAGFLLFILAGWVNAQTSNSIVTFNVDMSAQVLAGTFVPGAQVDVRGTFNGWGTNKMSNITVGGNSNLYTATVADTTDVNGGTVSYKYFAPSISSNNG